MDENNNEYSDTAILRMHIGNNLKNNSDEIIDKFIKNEFAMEINNVSDYILIRNKLIQWNYDSDYRNRLIELIIKKISDKFNFDDLISLLTDKLINILFQEENLPMAYELYKNMLKRTIIKLNESQFWRFYFVKIYERMEELKYNEQERYIINIINKSFANNNFELKI